MCVKLLVNLILPAESPLTDCRKKLSTGSPIFFPPCCYPYTQPATHIPRSQLPTTHTINQPLNTRTIGE